MTSAGKAGSPQSRKWMRSVPLRKKRSLNSGMWSRHAIGGCDPSQPPAPSSPRAAEALERDGARGDDVQRVDATHHGDPDREVGGRTGPRAETRPFGTHQECRAGRHGDAAAEGGDVDAVTRVERDQSEARVPHPDERRVPVRYAGPRKLERGAHGDADRLTIQRVAAGRGQ